MAPGHIAQFEAMVARVNEAYIQTGAQLHEEYGDTAPFAYTLLRKHLGAAEADPLIQRQLEAVIAREVVILRRRPDLSRS